MSTNGLLVDYRWCSGCHSCEIACKNEKGFDIDQALFGVKLLQVGPSEIDSKIEWDYVPMFTNLCDLCEERVARGEQPSCVLHCLARCLTYGPAEELEKKLEEKGGKAFLILP